MADSLPVFDDSVVWEDAQAELEMLGLGDGLPLVPPTARRLEAMLAGVVDADRSVAALVTHRRHAQRPAHRLAARNADTLCV